jgi:periplasmic protein TonB
LNVSSPTLPKPPENPDVHLSRLLAPEPEPFYKTLLQNLNDLVNPPKLPPLELTSKPVDASELKGLNGLYSGNQSKSVLTSFLLQCAVVALLFFLGTNEKVQNAVKDTVTLIAPDIRPYISKPKERLSQGGGGGGAKQLTQASKGALPKPAPKQFTPPKVDPPPDPKLPMLPTVVAPPDVPNIVANNYGDPLSRLGIPSNGTGSGGGIGSGIGGGVGPGRGAGVGPGSGGGFGGGAYKIGGGVSAPSVLFKVEPEYSEEARKAKWQGTVVLSLVVDENGKAQNLKVVRSLGLGLDQKAIEAVEKWRFKPGMKDGKSVPVIATIEVNFRLL